MESRKRCSVAGVTDRAERRHNSARQQSIRMPFYVALALFMCVVTHSDKVHAFQSTSSRVITTPTTSRCDRRQQKQQQFTPLQMISNNKNANNFLPAPLQTLRSPSTAISSDSDDGTPTSAPPMQFQIQLETLSRLLLPSALASLAAFFLFPPYALFLSYLINDSATFAVLSVDSSQFIQNFLTVTSLTFSILVGQTYYFMYQQQEAVFVSLFGEVTEAKSLLEQVALVCQGRRDMYEMCLVAVKRYVYHVCVMCVVDFEENCT